MSFPVEEVDPPMVREAALDCQHGIGAFDAPVTSGPFHPQSDNLPTGTLDDTGSDLHALLAIFVILHLRLVGGEIVDALRHGFIPVTMRRECGDDRIDPPGLQFRLDRLQLLLSFRLVGTEHPQGGICIFDRVPQVENEGDHPTGQQFPADIADPGRRIGDHHNLPGLAQPLPDNLTLQTPGKGRPPADAVNGGGTVDETAVGLAARVLLRLSALRVNTLGRVDAQDLGFAGLRAAVLLLPP